MHLCRPVLVFRDPPAENKCIINTPFVDLLELLHILWQYYRSMPCLMSLIATGMIVVKFISHFEEHLSFCDDIYGFYSNWRNEFNFKNVLLMIKTLSENSNNSALHLSNYKYKRRFNAIPTLVPAPTTTITRNSVTPPSKSFTFSNPEAEIGGGVRGGGRVSSQKHEI